MVTLTSQGPPDKKNFSFGFPVRSKYDYKTYIRYDHNVISLHQHLSQTIDPTNFSVFKQIFPESTLGYIKLYSCEPRLHNPDQIITSNLKMIHFLTTKVQQCQIIFPKYNFFPPSDFNTNKAKSIISNIVNFLGRNQNYEELINLF